MTRISLVATTAVLLALVGLAVAQHCIKDDFSGTSNPNGVWSYGSRVSPNFAGSMTSPDPFAIFTQQGFGGWAAGGTYPMVNPESAHITSAPNTGVEAVIRFTSTVAATATITGSARDFWTQESNKNVVIRHGNAADTTAPVAIVGPTDISTLPSRTLTIPATVVTLAAGDTIEFSSGGGLDYNRIIWEMCIDSVPITPAPPTCPTPGLASAFSVPATTSYVQHTPRVAKRPDGSFITAWNSADQDGHSTGVFTSQFDAQGQRIGSVVQVNGATNWHQGNADIAVHPDGSYVIVFDSNPTQGFYRIMGQRFHANGAKNGNEFRADLSTGGHNRFASVAALPNDEFAVAWPNSNGPVYVIVFNSNGTPKSSRIRADDASVGGNQQYPSVRHLGGGKFVVAWVSYQTRQVFAQLFDASGTKIGAQIEVQTTQPTFVTSKYMRCSATTTQNGGFVVAWSVYNGGDNDDVFAQEFTNTGAKVGNEIGVATGAGAQTLPSVAAFAGGTFTVTYTEGSSQFLQTISSNGATCARTLVSNAVANNNGWGSIASSFTDGEFMVLYRTSGDDVNARMSNGFNPSTLDPAVTAFCDDIATKCTQMDAECTTIRNGGETNVADDCDASVSACNDVYADCVEKVSNCPLV